MTKTTNDRRVAPSRREEDLFCPMHEDRDRDIREIKDKIVNDMSPKINRQTGQWTAFMWGASILTCFLLSGLVSFGLFIYKNINPIAVYMIEHKKEAEHGFEIIRENKNSISELHTKVDINRDAIEELKRTVGKNKYTPSP